MRRVLVLFFDLVALAGAQQLMAPNTIQVSATAQAKAAADTALVAFVISGEKTGLGDAYREAQSHAEQLRSILIAQRFDLDQTQLSAYAVRKQYQSGDADV